MKYVASDTFLKYLISGDDIYLNWSNRPLKYLFQIYVPINSKIDVKNYRTIFYINMDKWID